MGARSRQVKASSLATNTHKPIVRLISNVAKERRLNMEKDKQWLVSFEGQFTIDGETEYEAMENFKQLTGYVIEPTSIRECC